MDTVERWLDGLSGRGMTALDAWLYRRGVETTGEQLDWLETRLWWAFYAVEFVVVSVVAWNIMGY